MAKKRFSFEITVISVLITLLVLVIAIGTFTYMRLRVIAYEVNEATRPNTRISLIKQVLSDLTEAESSVKSYNLTQDTNYLTPFYNSLSVVDERMNELAAENWVYAEQVALIDSIDKLIEEKYIILNQLLSLKNDASITNELKRISQKIEEAERKQRKTKSQQPQRPNILQRIFGKEDSIEKVPPPANMDFKGVRSEVAKVRVEQSRQLQILNKKEMALTRDDKVVTDKIRLLVARVEGYEKASIARRAKRVAFLARETNLLIAAFCFVATLMLVSVCYVVVSYVRKNKAYRAALRKAKDEAEWLAKARENFMANMSHEIRTPMNAIAGFTDQVLQTPLNEQQKDHLTIVKKSVDHLLHIVNDILDYSKIEAGKLRFDAVSFSPADVVKEILALITPIATEKGLTISYHATNALPPVLVGDPVRLRQILLNVVSNAIKFTESGGINIKVAASVPENDTVSLNFSVIDTGTGIPQEKIQKIFGEFEQADSSISRKYGGTGLGLTITKKLVEMQQGSIEITSKQDQGTRVSFIIPYGVGSGTVAEPKTVEPTDMGRLQGKKIMVADDEEYNRKLAAVILKKWKIDIKEVKNGREAVDELKNNDYDLILMDLRMPEMDGITASKIIRGLDDPRKTTPIVALTATINPLDIEKCKEAGMQDVLSKPFKEYELYEKLMQVFFAVSPWAGTEQPGEETQRPQQQFDLEELKQLSNGDEDFFYEMIGIFIKTTRDGLQKIDEAITAQDWEAVADSAHKIVSPCRHIGAQQLLRTLKTIETDIRDRNETKNVAPLLAQAKEEANTIITALEAYLHENAPPA